MHSSVTDRDKQTWKNNQRPANSQIYEDTQLNNINRGFRIIEYKFVMRIFFQCEVLQKSLHKRSSLRGRHNALSLSLLLSPKSTGDT